MCGATQVTGLNNTGITVGFWSGGNSANMINSNLGFYAVRGTQFHEVNFPTTNNAMPQVDQLLGVNDHGVAVGFYTNAQGRNRGYEYNIHTAKFSRVLVPGAPRGKMGLSLTATAINNHGDVAGLYTAAGARPTAS
jgi:S-formylglutathione hydrolase FrmB